MEKMFNSQRALNMAASLSGSTSSTGLEDMTLSMVNGDDPIFIQQVGTLIEWVKEHEKPDVIYLSTSLLIGIAKAFKESVDIPIVCSLQDEEIWIDVLNKADADRVWEGIYEKTSYIERFVSSSEFYKSSIGKRFPLIADRIDVVYPGVDTAKYAAEKFPSDPVIGFFYRMNEENGLHILAKAFVKVKKTGRFGTLRLRIGGGYTAANKKFLKRVRRILSPYKGYVDWCDTYSLSEHAPFYKEITAICVPLTFEEGVGLYLCEAFAAGRPAIEPATGSFAEILGYGGGMAGGNDEGERQGGTPVGNAGILYSPNTADALADAIEQLLSDEELFNQCCENALRLSRTRYNYAVQGDRLVEIMTNVLKMNATK
ncbi:hypothetical protein FACS1894121_1100 [Bacteroidia bacterium]|nr:hypothetical protein FACS1894121_1100 [Bacteroidia bacterium]